MSTQFRISVTVPPERMASVVNAISKISGDRKEAEEVAAEPYGFVYYSDTAEEAQMLRRKLEKAGAVVSVEEPAQSCDPTDRADNRIRAYLASMRGTRDVVYRDDIAEANARGRSLIERLAISAEGTDPPRMRLTAAEMADVLSFMSCTEPVDLKGWWSDTYDGPSWVCGYHAVLRSLEASLRGASAPAEETPAGAETAAKSADPVPAIPASLFENDVSERLMNAAGIVGTVRNALDEDHAEEAAALAVAVSMLHKIDDEIDTACYKATEAWDLAHPDHPDAIERMGARRWALEGMRTAEKAAQADQEPQPA